MDSERWAQLEAATEEYVAAPATQAQFAEAAAALLQVRADCSEPAGHKPRGWPGVPCMLCVRRACCACVTHAACADTVQWFA